ncbi:unnamed protein product [Caenorhabditis sp. 36 PRJEB53466]|nr:unnamed protein product [Caenorhabditis sp. 36 PRJEB53466]
MSKPFMSGFRETCKKLSRSGDFDECQRGKCDLEHEYKFCCLQNDYCSWYNTDGFLYTCIGCAALLLVSIVLPVYDRLQHNHSMAKPSLRDICVNTYNNGGFDGCPDKCTSSTIAKTYSVCCEMSSYCSFYMQDWFLYTCIAVGALLLIVCVIVCICCCCCQNR